MALRGGDGDGNGDEDDEDEELPFAELCGAALIRELHVYGQVTAP